MAELGPAPSVDFSRRVARKLLRKFARRARGGPGRLTSSAGGRIRTLGVSLLAVAAIAVSVLIARQRHEKSGSAAHASQGEVQPAEKSLDAIRAAGL